MGQGGRRKSGAQRAAIPLRFKAPICDAFGEVLRRERKTRQLSKYELAKRSGLSQSTLAKLEQAGSNPRMDTIERVGRALGTLGLVLYAQATRLAQRRRRRYSTIS